MRRNMRNPVIMKINKGDFFYESAEKNHQFRFTGTPAGGRDPDSLYLSDQPHIRSEADKLTDQCRLQEGNADDPDRFHLPCLLLCPLLRVCTPWRGNPPQGA